MRGVSLALLLLGAGACAVLVLAIGVDPLAAALAPVGWGFAPIVLSHAAPLLLAVVAWRLLRRESAPPFAALAGARWVGEAVNNLLPVAQIGGELVRVRLAIMGGASATDAAASVIADVTIGALTQTMFGLAGAVVLIAWYDAAFALPLLGGLVVFGGGILLLYGLQRRGSVLPVRRLVQRAAAALGRYARFDGAERMHRALDGLYADRSVTVGASIWRLAGWIAGAGEILLSLHFLGRPASWTEAFILESLSQAARSAAFAVPGGLGVQEVGFLALGTALGLDPPTCLALGLIRRGRDVVLGLPALAAYLCIEARRSAAGRAR
jgi:putative membrane protein